MTTSPPSQQQILRSNAYHNFIIHFRNQMTKLNYSSRLKKFFKYCQVETYDDLLFGNDIKLIQSKIEDFLIHTQNLGLSSSTLSGLRNTLRYFYEMNDITNLNWRKISKVMSEYKRVADDRPYSVDEISRMLDKCDHRGRVIILLMVSTGMRVGAISSLKIGHIERINEIYKITVYKNYKEEYTTFCSPECAKAIDEYLEYRQRHREIIKSSAPLIREQFNKENVESASNPRGIETVSIKIIIYRAVNDAGIREKKNIVKDQPRVPHDVMQTHGLRKFFNTRVVTEGKMSPLYAEMLMGHHDGLAMESYVKPTVSQLYEEYMKVVDFITIDNSIRLKQENQVLKIRADKVDGVLQEIAELKKSLGL